MNETACGQTVAVNVTSADRETPLQAVTMPVVIVLDRLRSAFNVGNIFRLADAVRAERIVACGYTAVPPHPKLTKTARGCDEIVPCATSATAVDAIASLHADGYTVYGVETTETSTLVWDETLVFPAAIVFGNEALGVCPGALHACDRLLRIPAVGVKNSVNVANCAAVVLCEAWRQWCQSRRPIE